MPRKTPTDFVIDERPTAGDSDDPDTAAAPPLPTGSAGKKKGYNFSEARRKALERGRQKRAENIKRQKAEREAQRRKLKADKEEALAEKIQQQLEEEVEADAEVVKRKVQEKRSERKRAPKAVSAPVARATDGSGSDSDLEDGSDSTPASI